MIKHIVMFKLKATEGMSEYDNALEAKKRFEDVIAKVEELKKGELVINSIDTDGVKQGFDLEMLEAVCNVVNVPVIASGGAGNIDHFIQLFKALPKVDAGLAASIFHFGQVRISDLKQTLKQNGIPVRI